MSKNTIPAQPSRLAHALRIALLGLPMIAMAGAVAAQDAATTTGLAVAAQQLDRIDVTGEVPAYLAPRSSVATKTDAALRDVPQSVSVITDTFIRDQSMQSMADVVRYVPGVQIAQGEGHRDAPILRGNTSTADFFVDGLRDDLQYFRDLYNVERIEVLKGPVGMVFGRGGAGGLINRVTKQADGSSPRQLGLTVGSWDNLRLTGDYGQAIGEQAAFRVTGLYQDADSYRDFGHLERWAINPSLNFQPTEATGFTFGYEHFEDDRVVDRGVPSVAGRPLDTKASTFFGSPEESYATARVDALTAKFSHAFAPGVELANHFRYADQDKFYQNVFAGGFTPATNQVRIVGYNNRTTRESLLNQTDLTFTTRSGGIEHQWLVGAEFNRQETGNFRNTAFFPTAGSNATADMVTLPQTVYRGPVAFRQSASDADNRSVATTAAVYLQDQISFSPHWLAVLGLRYDRFEADLFNRRNGSTLDSDDDLLSPRAGLVYKPVDSVSLYAIYSTTHVPRAGEQLASLTPSNRVLEPEKFVNLEIGAKWDVSERLAFTAAVFQLDQDNVAVVDPNDATRSILVDGQRVEGVELGLTGQLTEAWQVVTGYAYQDSEILTPGSNRGHALGQVPSHSFSVWNKFDLTERFGIGIGANYRSDVFVAVDNAVVLPGYTRVDAAAFFRVNDNLRLQLNVENLFDEDYYASAHNNHNILPGSPLAVRLGAELRF